MCQVGGDYFAFIVDDSLELTRANIAALAEEAGDRAYWADESAIAVLQRYLNVRLLIFKPTAESANQCACVAPAEVPEASAPSGPPSYIVLRHSHRASKEQHYDLYGLHASRVAVFDEASLPAGVKRAFSGICLDAKPSWKHAADSEGGSAVE